MNNVVLISGVSQTEKEKYVESRQKWYKLLKNRNRLIENEFMVAGDGGR